MARGAEMRIYRTLTPPLVTILALSAGMTGCNTEARRQRKAAEAARQRQQEDSLRREAETQAPTEMVLNQVRSATEAFMAEHHGDLNQEGSTFTALTPNLFLVGVSVREKARGNTYVKQLTAERLRDVDEDDEGDVRNGELLWVMDYLDAQKMQVLARRHGLESEVEAIRRQDPDHRHGTSWGHRSWLDNYLLWHFMFGRPAAMGFWPGQGFRPMPSGYRFHDPARPIRPGDAQPFQAATAPTGGRSMIFLGGSAWRPPVANRVGPLPGQAFMARGAGVSSRAPMGSMSRGGFGHSGHIAGHAGS